MNLDNPYKRLKNLRQGDAIEMLEIQIELLQSNLEFLKKAKEDREKLGVSIEKVFDCFSGGEIPSIITIFPSNLLIIEYLFQTIEIPFRLLGDFLPNLENENYVKMLIESIKKETKK